MPKEEVKDAHEHVYAGVLSIPLNNCGGYNHLRIIHLH